MHNPQASSGTFTDNIGDTLDNSGNMSTTGRYSDSTDRGRSTLGDTVRGIASQAQEKTGEQLRSGVDAGKMRAASALHGVAQSLLGGAEGQEDGIGGYIRQAGEQARRAADFLENTDVRQLTRRTEEYARRQPAIFLGGAFALGLIASRFLKSSHRSASPGTARNDESSHMNSVGGRHQSGGHYRSAVDSSSPSESEMPVRSYREPMPSSPSGMRASGDSSREGTQS